MEEKVFTIDRFEDIYAVCEEKETKDILNIEISKLPKGIKEGDIIVFKNNKYLVDKKNQKDREASIKQKMDKLWKK